MQPVHFERAIFLSWYCARPDCTFCYMSTIKDQISDPRKARRRPESIFTEAIIAKVCNWKIEFLSGGIHSYGTDELVDITKTVSEIMGEKQWLNFGIFRKEQLKKFLPYVKGMTGTVECINPEVHDTVCPTKPLSDVVKMFQVCDEVGLQKAITIIIGLGETEEDIPLLIDFIKKHDVDRITFYRLVPHEGTPFKEGPSTAYYTTWIKATREAFPNLDIIAGSWADKLNELPALLAAGANALTKFRGIRYFGTEYAKAYHERINSADYDFKSTFLDIDDKEVAAIINRIDVSPERKEKIRFRTADYIKKMRRRMDSYNMPNSSER